MNKEAEIILTQVMQAAEKAGGTGAEKKAAVNATIVDIINEVIPITNFIPDSLAEDGLEFCEDKAMEGLKAIAHKIGDCIEAIFKKVFRKK